MSKTKSLTEDVSDLFRDTGKLRKKAMEYKIGFGGRSISKSLVRKEIMDEYKRLEDFHKQLLPRVWKAENSGKLKIKMGAVMVGLIESILCIDPFHYENLERKLKK